MEVKLERTKVADLKTGALILLDFEDQRAAEPYPGFHEAGESAGKALEFTLVHHPPGYAATRVLLAGAGKSGAFNAAELRKVSGAAVRFLKSKSIKHVALGLDQSRATPENVAAAVEGALLGDFECDQHKSDKAASKFLASFAVAVPVDGLEEALTCGIVMAEAQNFARSLANEPPNLLTPSALADSARKMAEQYGLGCEVLDRGRMQQLGFGALLGVAQGSVEPPVLIVLRYTPENAIKGAHLGLVGKAVTFDTGGVSIKPAEGMEKMKYDMAGGAAVIGAMQAIAQLKPAVTVTALVPSVENMCGGRAQRPSDIVTTLSGKTVEVLNTDAEGRMILADALTYAQRLGCTHLVDAATLTGGIVVALGHINTGVFASDDALFGRWMDAARAQGEKMWNMPIDDEYKELLKSAFADLQNIGGRYGSAVTAAMFLKEFAGSTPWVHLDIAGTAWLDEAKPWMAKGPTGTPMRSFVELARAWSS